MPMTFTIKPGYKGMCTHVAPGFMCKNDATHFEYQAFDEPIPVPEALKGIMEPVQGVWSGFCEEHRDPSRPQRD